MIYLVPVLAGLLGLVVGVLVTAWLAARPLPGAWRPTVERPRDVVVPLMSAVVCAAFGVRFGLSPVLAAYLFLGLLSVTLAAIDVEQHRLPDVLTLPSYVISLVLLGLAALFVDDGWGHLLTALFGMAGLWVVYLLLHLANPAGMGWGDVKLAGVLGAYLGWLGGETWLIGAFLGVLLGGVFAMTLLLLRMATAKTAVPFGPFMIAGALVAVLLSEYRILF